MENRSLRVLEFDKISLKLRNHAVSDMGKDRVEELFPSTDIDVIKAWQKETSDAVGFISSKGLPPLGGIRDIRVCLKRLEMGAVLTLGELLNVCDVLRVCRNLKSLVRDDHVVEDGNIVKILIAELEPNKRIEDRIDQSIESDEVMRDNASTTLANIRRQSRDLQQSIKEKLNNLIRSSKYQKYMQEALVTIRGERYVIPVKQEYRSEFPGLVHDSSGSGATLFIEPMSVVETNNGIKQLKIKEAIEIEKILRELSTDVVSILYELKANCDILSRLDFILAKAKLSLELECSCPIINNEGRLVIRKGRHPLIDKKNVVPIDFWIGKDFTTLIITGPNTGGKTVTLKTCGLFTLMAQSGLQVPAGDGTELAVFDNVFADIGDEQSIEQSLSTFSSHMKNIVHILDHADENSLVLFDELGAGTDPTEGAALAMAILEKLKERKIRTVATTHYSELKMYGISKDGIENACCEFDVQSLRPTYKLLIGIPGKSNAFAISKRLGLSEQVLSLAGELVSEDNLKFEDVLETIEKNKSDALRDSQIAQRERVEIETLKNEIEIEKKKIQESREKILREGREEARRILTQAKNESETILLKLKEYESQKDKMEIHTIKSADALRTKLKGSVEKLEIDIHAPLFKQSIKGVTPKNLKVGESVHIVSLSQKGTVLTAPDAEGNTLTQVGIMKINVRVSDLRRIEEQKTEYSPRISGKVNIIKTAVGLEIDLRGMNLDDAIEAVDKYLDDATIAGLHEVTLIHGKGTGVLRTGIQQFLKRHPHVNKFRDGKYGEGEMGVTVVEVK